MGVLESIRDKDAGESYPTDLLTACDTALVLFSSMFMGRQDAFWIKEAGLRATCVDIRGPELRRMQRLYPPDWKFVEDDVYHFAALADEEWDVVSLDPPTGQFDLCAEMTNLWTGLAREVVILGSDTRTHELAAAPRGWTKGEPRYRSSFAGGVFWTTLVRD